MGGDGGAEVGAAVQGLEDARGEDASRELDPPEDGVGGEGRGLDEDAVAGDEGGDDLDGGEDQGEVPGAEGGDEAEGVVRGDDAGGGVFVLDVVGEGVGGVVEGLGYGVCDVDVGEEGLGGVSEGGVGGGGGRRTDLPVSRERMEASSPRLSRRTSASLIRAAWRSGTVVWDHEGKAAWAAATASSKSWVVATGQGQRASSVRGLVTVVVFSLPRSSSLMMLKNWGSAIVGSDLVYGEGGGDGDGDGEGITARREKVTGQHYTYITALPGLLPTTGKRPSLIRPAVMRSVVQGRVPI